MFVSVDKIFRDYSALIWGINHQTGPYDGTVQPGKVLFYPEIQ